MGCGEDLSSWGRMSILGSEPTFSPRSRANTLRTRFAEGSTAREQLVNVSFVVGNDLIEQSK